MKVVQKSSENSCVSCLLVEAGRRLWIQLSTRKGDMWPLTEVLLETSFPLYLKVKIDGTDTKR